MSITSSEMWHGWLASLHDWRNTPVLLVLIVPRIGVTQGPRSCREF